GDLGVAREIMAGIKPELQSRVRLYAYEGNLAEALRLMGTFRLMIAARFHANIIALLQGTGVLPVIYSEKTVNMLKDLGLDKLIVEMDRLAMLSDEFVLAAAQSNTMPLADTARRAEAQFAGLDKLAGKRAATTA